MSCAAQWHFTTWLDLFDHWQTLWAAVFAVLAAVGTIWATRSTAAQQIASSREDAERVIGATREQARAVYKQSEWAFDLEQMRNASEALAFHAMLEAAMVRVLSEAAWARSTYPDYVFTQQTGSSVDAFAIRRCITKGAFAELRSASVRRGGALTGDFLDLEREIDSFAAQIEDSLAVSGALIQLGKHHGLGEQLALIETKATELREKAYEAFEQFTAKFEEREAYRQRHDEAGLNG